MTKGRVKYCDNLKAISIILVILIHILAIYRDMYLANNNMLYYFILSFADSFTRVAVPMFFMITGIFMLNKEPEKSYNVYIKKRLLKLLIPLIVFSIIYYLFENIEAGNKLSTLTFFQQLTSSDGARYHLWFMYEIIKIYLLIPFLYVMINNLNKKSLKNLIILLFIMGNLIQFIELMTNRYNINLFSGIPFNRTTICINYLFVGYYLYKYDLKSKTRKIIYVGAILSLIALPITDLFFIDGMRNDLLFVATSVFPILPTLALFLIFKNNYHKWNIMKKVEPITSFIAKQSLWIYLIHVIVMELLMKYLPFPQRFISVIISIALILSLTVIISSGLAIIFDWSYKKIFESKNKERNVLKKSKKQKRGNL